MLNDFSEDLAYSESASCENFWGAVYKKAFPNMISSMTCNAKSEAQERGIDRVIMLSNGFEIYIDEKKRRKSYPDIVLEYVSNDKTGAKGWIEKDLAINYMAYAFMDIQTVYLFDWVMLRRAWQHYKKEWLIKYKIPPAQNKFYKTLNVAIPIDLLRKSVCLASVIRLEANNENIP